MGNIGGKYRPIRQNENFGQKSKKNVGGGKGREGEKGEKEEKEEIAEKSGGGHPIDN